MAALAIYVVNGNTSFTGPVIFTGYGTSWLTSTPTFTVDDPFTSIGAATVIDDTHATVDVVFGSGQIAYTFTDSTTGATATVRIQLTVGPMAYDRINQSVRAQAALDWIAATNAPAPAPAQPPPTRRRWFRMYRGGLRP